MVNNLSLTQVRVFMFSPCCCLHYDSITDFKIASTRLANNGAHLVVFSYGKKKLSTHGVAVSFKLNTDVIC